MSKDQDKTAQNAITIIVSIVFACTLIANGIFCFLSFSPLSKIKEINVKLDETYTEISNPASAFSQKLSNDISTKLVESVKKAAERRGMEPKQNVPGAAPESYFDKKVLENYFGGLNASISKIDTKLDSNKMTIDLNPIIERFNKLEKQMKNFSDSASNKVNSLNSFPDSSAPAGKPVEFDPAKIKGALKADLEKIGRDQANLSAKVDSLVSGLGGISQIKSDLDKINSKLVAQQEAKKETKFQPVFLLLLSKGFKPQRDAVGLIVQKLSTPAADGPLKSTPTILLSADGNQRNVLAVSGFNQASLNTWLDNNDLREIKAPIDLLPSIISEKTPSNQPRHVVILAGHNCQLDKTKDLAAWEKIERITFVFVEPPSLGNIMWENFNRLKNLRKQKNLQTDQRIFKTNNEFDSSFKLEVDEVEDLTKMMRSCVIEQ